MKLKASYAAAYWQGGRQHEGRQPHLLTVVEGCNHGTLFDEAAAVNLSASEVRKRWPRFSGTCLECGYSGIYYASFMHYVSGDW